MAIQSTTSTSNVSENTLTLEKLNEVIKKFSEFKSTFTHYIVHPSIADKFKNDLIVPGIEKVESTWLTKDIQTRLPRCNKKKNRIVKKFKKKYSKTVADENVLLINTEFLNPFKFIDKE